MVETSKVNLEFFFLNNLELYFETCDRLLFAAKSLALINNISEDLCSRNLNIILLEFSRNVTT
jgi:hypothetical protein